MLGMCTGDELEFLNEEALELAGFDSTDYTVRIREAEPPSVVRVREALWPLSSNIMKTGEGRGGVSCAALLCRSQSVAAQVA